MNKLPPAMAPMLFLAACGDNNDTILTGFSGVLIFGLIVWVIFRYVSKRK